MVNEEDEKREMADMSISDNNITNMNKLSEKSFTGKSDASKIWRMDKKLGVSDWGNEEDMIRRIKEMEICNNCKPEASKKSGRVWH
ncbi:hypothetical protein Ancab_012465 [Ancistrocladus abbreviatus]